MDTSQDQPPSVPPVQSLGYSDALPVSVNRSKPRGQRSEKVQGSGQVHVSPDRMSVDFKATRNGLAILLALAATTVTFVIVLLVSAAGLPAFGPGFLIWYFVFVLILKKARHFDIDPREAHAALLRHGKIASVELPDGRWVGLKPRRKDRDTLASKFREVFGDRLATA